MGDLGAMALLNGINNWVVIIYYMLYLFVLFCMFLYFIVLGLQLFYNCDQTLQSGHHFFEGLSERLLLGIDKIAVLEKMLWICDIFSEQL